MIIRKIHDAEPRRFSRLNITPFLKFLMIVGIAVVTANLISCKKFIEVKAPVTSINQKNVFASDATAISAFAGIYSNMNPIFNGNSGITLFTGLSADELTLWSGVTNNNLIALYKNQLVQNAGQQYGATHWPLIYNLVYNCNAAIEGLKEANKLTHKIRQQLLGEAHFLRAFFYFYLTNLFGEVPLLTTTDYDRNLALSNATVREIYEQIQNDLHEAENLLSEDFLGGDLMAHSPQRIRPTKWAAKALLARTYLFIEQWDKAETAATQVINERTRFELDSNLNTVFLAESKEAIWQLQPVTIGRNTDDGISFIIPLTGPSDVSGDLGNPVYLSSDLLQSFETNDLRKQNWIGRIEAPDGITYYFPHKYKVYELNQSVTEYLMLIRLSELFLIRAEARGKKGNITGPNSGIDDINIIRERAGLPEVVVTAEPELMTTIMHERRVELFTELGHRWFDLKRTHTVDDVMAVASQNKGATWQSYQQLYPIPFTDIQNAPNLKQNLGY